jgi:hypothetical protein
VILLALGCTPPLDSGAPSDTASAPAALRVSPEALDFGAIPRGCTAAEQSVWVENTGGAALSILSAAVTGSGSSAFSLTLPDAAIPGGTSAAIPVTFTPTALYDYALPLTVQTDAGSATVTLSGVGVAGGTVTDTATLTLNERVDVLLVVDTTASMAEPLAALQEAMPALWSSLTGEGVSVHLGVVTMDMEADDQSGRLQALLTESDEPPTLPPPSSTATEQGLSALRAALSEPLLSAENADFRRTDAALSAVIFSDEDDDSDLKLSEVGDWLEQEGITLHAMVEARKPDQVCQTEPGTRYLELQEATGGRFIALCTETPGEALAGLAQTILGISATFLLSQTPDSADGIVVTKNDEPVAPGLTDGWTLDTTDATITLHGTAAPVPGDTLTFTYTATTCP